MFISLDLNRKNINRAISDNMLRELGRHMLCYGMLNCSQVTGMNTNDFNYGQTVSIALANIDRMN
jgi:hypothetical protein